MSSFSLEGFERRQSSPCPYTGPVKRLGTIQRSETHSDQRIVVDDRFVWRSCCTECSSVEAVLEVHHSDLRGWGISALMTSHCVRSTGSCVKVWPARDHKCSYSQKTFTSTGHHQHVTCQMFKFQMVDLLEMVSSLYKDYLYTYIYI